MYPIFLFSLKCLLSCSSPLLWLSPDPILRRTSSLLWLGIALSTCVGALYLYCGPLQRIFHSVRLRHFPGTDQEVRAECVQLPNMGGVTSYGIAIKLTSLVNLLVRSLLPLSASELCMSPLSFCLFASVRICTAPSLSFSLSAYPSLTCYSSVYFSLSVLPPFFYVLDRSSGLMCSGSTERPCSSTSSWLWHCEPSHCLYTPLLLRLCRCPWPFTSSGRK